MNAVDNYQLSAEELEKFESAQLVEKAANLQVRALAAELALAKLELDKIKEQAQLYLLDLRAAHGITPDQDAILERTAAGVVRFVVNER